MGSRRAGADIEHSICGLTYPTLMLAARIIFNRIRARLRYFARAAVFPGMEPATISSTRLTESEIQPTIETHSWIVPDIINVGRDPIADDENGGPGTSVRDKCSSSISSPFESIDPELIIQFSTWPWLVPAASAQASMASARRRRGNPHCGRCARRAEAHLAGFQIDDYRMPAVRFVGHEQQTGRFAQAQLMEVAERQILTRFFVRGQNDDRRNGVYRVSHGGAEQDRAQPWPWPPNADLVLGQLAFGKPRRQRDQIFGYIIAALAVATGIQICDAVARVSRLFAQVVHYRDPGSIARLILCGACCQQLPGFAVRLQFKDRACIREAPVRLGHALDLPAIAEPVDDLSF